MQELLNVFQKSLLAIQKHWFSLLTITFITEGVVLFATSNWSNYLNQQNFSLLGDIQGFVKGVLGLMTISMLTPIGKSATVYLINKKDLNLFAGLQAYLAVLKKLHLVLLAGLIWFVGTFVGLAFLVVPGVIFFFGSQFAIQILVVQNVGIFDAFKQSWKLVKQNIWTLIAMFLIIQIVEGEVADFITSMISSVWPSVAGFGLDWFVGTFTALLVYVPLAVMYLERKEKVERV